MQLRFVQILRGKSLVKSICVLAVVITSILHVDVSFASIPPDCIAFSMTQDDDEDGGVQVVAERCHFCSMMGLAWFVTPVALKPEPSGLAPSLISFKLPTAAPPPKS